MMNSYILFHVDVLGINRILECFNISSCVCNSESVFSLFDYLQFMLFEILNFYGFDSHEFWERVKVEFCGNFRAILKFWNFQGAHMWKNLWFSFVTRISNIWDIWYFFSVNDNFCENLKLLPKKFQDQMVTLQVEYLE